MGKKLNKLMDKAVAAKQEVLKLKLSTFDNPLNGPSRASHEYSDRSIWEEFNNELHNPDTIRAKLEDEATTLKDKFDIGRKIALGRVAMESIEHASEEIERCMADINFKTRVEQYYGPIGF